MTGSTLLTRRFASSARRRAQQGWPPLQDPATTRSARSDRQALSIWPLQPNINGIGGRVDYTRAAPAQPGTRKGPGMKWKMAENSLFAVLLRSPWWISGAVALGLGGLAFMLPCPPDYRFAGAFGAAAVRRHRRAGGLVKGDRGTPSASRVKRNGLSACARWRGRPSPTRWRRRWRRYGYHGEAHPGRWSRLRARQGGPPPCRRGAPLEGRAYRPRAAARVGEGEGGARGAGSHVGRPRGRM